MYTAVSLVLYGHLREGIAAFEALLGGVPFEGIGETDMERLVSWDWPGNVRELKHTIERAALLSEPPRLRIPPLEGGLRQESGALSASVATASAATASEFPLATLAEVERLHVLRVLERTRVRVTGVQGAAEILGLKPSTLNFRIRKLGLTERLAGIRAQARRDPPSCE